MFRFNQKKLNDGLNSLSNKEIFDTICDLAKEKNVEGLSQFLAQGYSIGTYYGAINPISQLAKEGDKKSVSFLLDYFNASLNDAVKGAAMLNDYEWVCELLDQGASPNHALIGLGVHGDYPRNRNFAEELISKGAKVPFFIIGLAMGNQSVLLEKYLRENHEYNEYAIQGYARGKHFEAVKKMSEDYVNPSLAILFFEQIGEVEASNALMSDDEHLDCAVNGAARFGDKKRVQNFLDLGASLDAAVAGSATAGNTHLSLELIQNGAKLNTAIFFASKNGHIDLTNYLLKQKNAGFKCAFKGYQEGFYLTSLNSVSRLFYFTDDSKLQNQLADLIDSKKSGQFKKIFKIKPKQSPQLKYVSNIYSLMSNRRLDPMLAKAWAIAPNLHIWFLQGIQMVKDNKIPLEIFIHISSFVLGLPNDKTNMVFSRFYQTMSQRLRDNLVQKALKKQSKKGKEANNEKIEQAVARYEQRMKNW